MGVKYLLRAAEFGDGESMMMVGQNYRNGSKGFEKNWIRRARLQMLFSPEVYSHVTAQRFTGMPVQQMANPLRQIRINTSATSSRTGLRRHLVGIVLMAFFLQRLPCKKFLQRHLLLSSYC